MQICTKTHPGMIPRAWSINARGAKTQICSNPNVVYKFIIIIIYFVKR